MDSAFIIGRNKRMFRLQWDHRRLQSMEEIEPDAFGSPADVAVVEGLARPVFRRSINPAPTGLENMDDAADHPAVANKRLATRISR
jgi:hypothetical protein